MRRVRAPPNGIHHSAPWHSVDMKAWVFATVVLQSSTHLSSARPCPAESPALKSLIDETQEQMTVSFESTLGQEVTVNWVDQNGNEVVGSHVAGFSRHEITSFPGHAFRVRTLAGSLLIKEVVVQENVPLIEINSCDPPPSARIVDDAPAQHAPLASPGGNGDTDPVFHEASKPRNPRVIAAWTLLAAVLLVYLPPNIMGWVRSYRSKREADRQVRLILMIVSSGSSS